MKGAVVLVGFLAAVVSMFGVAYLLRSDSELPKLLARPPAEQDADEFEPSREGPWPKAVIDQTEFDFGRMEAGDKKSFTFTIRNEGEAPLKLGQGTTTCQCTISELDQKELLPGETAQVTLTWQPTTHTDMFEKGAEIKTNDPDPKRRSILLKVLGMVAPRVRVNPEREWRVENLRENSDTRFRGLVVSHVIDAFEIEGLDYDPALLSATPVPLSEEQLKDIGALSGYWVDVSVQPGMPIGRFSIPLKIKTTIPVRKSDGSVGPEKMVADVLVTGHRRGPIRILGPEWYEEASAINLGTFDSTQGRKVSLMMLVTDAPEGGVRFIDLKTRPERLKVELVPDDKFRGAAKRYFLTVEYPAGAPRIACRDSMAGSIIAQTNHPEASEMKFEVHFTAY